MILLKCPICGSQKFARVMKEVVTIEDTGEGLVDEIQEGLETSFFCFECGCNVTDEELAR